MPTLAIMSVLWIAVVAAFVALMVYRGHLTQHETDELFLSDAVDDSNRKREHDDIVRRVNRIQPYCKGVGGAAALITVAIIGVEVFRFASMVQ
jgi:hypothetical protein